MLNISRAALCALLVVLPFRLLAQAERLEEPPAPTPSSPSTADKPLEKAFSKRGGEICFDLPEGLVNWEKLAKSSLGAWHFAHPDRKHLGPRESEAADLRPVSFYTPVPPQVAELKWQILHEAGSVLLQPKILRLTVTYHVERDDPYRLTDEIWFDGKACAPAGIRFKGAFVVKGSSGKWPSEAVASWSSEPRRSVSVKTSEGRYTLRAPNFAIPRIRRAQLFRPEGLPPHLLVAWSLGSEKWDYSFCESAFSLFELRPEGKAVLIAENGYDCDV